METIRCTTVLLEPLGQVYVGYTGLGISYLTTNCRTDAEFAEEVGRRYGCAVVRDDTRRAEWHAVLRGWLAGEVDPREVPLDLTRCTAFDRRVMDLAMAIPRGEVRTYGQLAVGAGSPGGSRAVGGVMRRNPVPLLVPCHRVVASSGVIGNYSMGGAAVKKALLGIEGVPLERLKELVLAAAAGRA